MKFNFPKLDALRNATTLLKSRGPLAATAAIQSALKGGAVVTPPASAHPIRDINPAPGARAAGAPAAVSNPPAAGSASPVDAPAAGMPAAGSPATHTPTAGMPATRTPDFVADLLAELGVYADPSRRTQAAPEAGAQGQPAGGRFIAGSYTNSAGTRQYKLYEPRDFHGESLPLIVMLHGCTQNPDDFAAGTRMNAIADEQRCLVLYPAQSKSANSSGCWNWFQPGDQQRDDGEPSIIAGMTREVIANSGADASQVYVAGLSAGGAMALIMGTVYADLFTAVGVHSGLPYASAQDLPSALAAMKGSFRPRAATAAAVAPLPMIIFHGDQDRTVSDANAKQIIAQWTAGHPDAQASEQTGSSANGRGITRTSIKNSAGQVVAEDWRVQGAGHAWFGGSSNGSYTEQRGPDASQEMVRFFFTQKKPGQI